MEIRGASRRTRPAAQPVWKAVLRISPQVSGTDPDTTTKAGG